MTCWRCWRAMPAGSSPIARSSSAVWGPAHADDTQYLRVFVGQLRAKIEVDPEPPKLILTEPGIGYRLWTDEFGELACNSSRQGRAFVLGACIVRVLRAGNLIRGGLCSRTSRWNGDFDVI